MLGKFNTSSIEMSAWEMLITQPQVRKDLAILEATSRLVNNNAQFITSNLDKTKNILERIGEAGARCRTCASSGVNTGLKYIDEIIDDLNWSISKFKNTEGYDKLLTEMAASGDKADGGAFMLQVLKSRGDVFTSQIKKFESFYLSGTKLEADIELLTGKLMEFKSYKSASWANFFGAANSSTLNQLQGYLKNGSSFEYIANGSKLTDQADKLKFVKEQFQRVFKVNNSQIYDDVIAQNPNAFLGLGINNKADFIRKVNNVDDAFYNFVKIE